MSLILTFSLGKVDRHPSLLKALEHVYQSRYTCEVYEGEAGTVDNEVLNFPRFPLIGLAVILLTRGEDSGNERLVGVLDLLGGWSEHKVVEG